MVILNNPALSSITTSDPIKMEYETNHQWLNNPFHMGEIAIHQHLGIQHDVMSYAPQFIRNYMPDQHREFFTTIPFIVAAIRDPISNTMWATLLVEHKQLDHNTTTTTPTPTTTTTSSFIQSPDPYTLQIRGGPVDGDAIHHVFQPTDQERTIDIGLLGIQFEVKRRNRVNGHITMVSASSSSSTSSSSDDSSNNPNNDERVLTFHVDQSYGNCPQYIKPRKDWYFTNTHDTPSTTSNPILQHPSKIYPTILTPTQTQWINTAETVFTATGYHPDQSHDDVYIEQQEKNPEFNKRYGNDASHRGGPPGFIQVILTNDSSLSSKQEIVWTEFNGNKFFNSLGNIIMDSHIGLCIPNFQTGAMLQITGTATIEFGDMDIGGRKVRVQVLGINELPAGSIPLQWNDDGNIKSAWSDIHITKIVQESSIVKSFYIQPPPNDPTNVIQKFKAGQHLPIQLIIDDKVIQRSYSLSANPNTAFREKYYRISVKHHPNGQSSSYLHNHMKIGDTIRVGQPGGDFILNHTTNSVVLVSAGIGITPVLSMLHEIMDDITESNSNQEHASPPHHKNIYWIHGARNGSQHAMREELNEIIQKSLHRTDILLHHYNVYSSPEPNDVYNSTGHITAEYIYAKVPDIITNPAGIYMCGPLSFLVDIQKGLESLGVDGKNIFYETF